MNKILIPLLLILLIGCKMPDVVVGMSELQFKKEHHYAYVVETSAYRTVYKEPDYASYKFYYFKDGRLFLMDPGYTPIGAKEPVPSR